jgi:glycine amidinotransferase
LNPVNSFTEWGPLEEVILGSHYNTGFGELDVSVQLLYHDNLVRARRLDPTRTYSVNRRYIEEREEDVAGLAEVLRSRGIVVRRPEVLSQPRPFSTPYWCATTKACDNPRDQVLIAGTCIIETSCCVRNRYFENDLLKGIFYDYFRQGARWICSPRPTMQDTSFDYSYTDPSRLALEGHIEMMFDAAQCLRFGKDILFNVQTKNHDLGFRWLEQVLSDSFRLHRVAIVDNHLDGAILPLRPGTILATERAASKRHLFPHPLPKWEWLTMLEEDRSKYGADELLLASSRINVNVLSLDERHVVIDDHSTDSIRLLERHGFTPIPIRFRHSRIFGGGLHCVSLDIRRKESQEDYFG